MPAYTAKFSKGETKAIANSKREYAAAWLMEIRSNETGSTSVTMGFAASREMAEKAAAREFAGCNSTPRWRRQRGEISKPMWALVRSEVIDLKQEG